MVLFSDALSAAIKKKHSIICVGLDPRIEHHPRKYGIPPHLIEDSDSYSEAIWRFNKAIIDATYSITPVYKPQIAFYELYDALDALKKTIRYIHQKGALVILDAKRNDIGSTAEAYAKTVFENFGADAVTVNAYFGIDGVRPFLKYIAEGKGVIILFKTSNPSGGDLQDLFVIETGEFGSTSSASSPVESEKKDAPSSRGSNPLSPLSLENIPQEQPTISLPLTIDGNVQPVRATRLYRKVVQLARRWALDETIVGKGNVVGDYGYSSIGGVVGATYPSQLKDVRGLFPEAYLLIPGYGAQGGKAEDIVYGVNEDGLGAIVNSSRAIDYAYLNPEYRERLSAIYPDIKPELLFAEAAKVAAEDMRTAINDALKNAGKSAY